MARRKHISSNQARLAYCNFCDSFIQSSTAESHKGEVFCSEECIEDYEEAQKPSGQAETEAEGIGESASQVIIPDE